MAKIQPAVKTLSFVLSNSLGEGAFVTSFIDLSQCASVVNRRFYRQGLNWVVSGFKFISHGAWSGTFWIKRIPDTWCVSNSWHKSYAKWKQQQDEAIAESSSHSAVAKFRDFKIHMSTEHFDAGFLANGRPVDSNLSPFLQGEWQHSQIVVPNLDPDASGSDVVPREFALHMVGQNNHLGLSRGVVSGYAQSRAFPQSPDPVSPSIEDDTNWMRDMFDVGSDTEDITRNATQTNDELPYDQDDYPGGENNSPFLQTVDRVSILSNAVFGNVSARGDTFPCGLIEVNATSEPESPTSAINMLVYLVPGPSRGYLTQPMQDM